MAENALEETQPGAHVAVVMLPLPAHGHLNQLLHLARLLAGRRGISVHFFGSSVHNRQLRDRSPSDADDRVIRFHDVPLSITSFPPPDPSGATKIPVHLQPAFDAALDLRDPLATLCRTLVAATRRVVVIHDAYMPLAAEVAADIPGVETYCFHPISAIDTLCFLWVSKGRTEEEARDELGLPYVAVEGVISDAFLKFYSRQLQTGAGVVSGRLLNSCRALEAPFIRMLTRDCGWQPDKTFAVGPLNMAAGSPGALPRDGAIHECLLWLNDQPPVSVVYVSFGSTMDLSDEEVAQLAGGLEASGHRFLWVFRDADRADNYAAAAADDGYDGGGRMDKLPPGFCERNDGVGKVFRSWAPQPEILAHPSTAGFISHCGWNSCMEAFAAGVPILTWPMHSDQPMNALLATHVLGVGLTVRDWANAEEAVPAAATVSNAIKRLMESEEGREARRKAKELSVEVRRGMEDGGSSSRDMDAFVALITR